MAGRKTIMVDTDVAERIDHFKHNHYLRSSSDAIDKALDMAYSCSYYVGIRAIHNSNGTLYHVVESFGRTEEEAVFGLIAFEDGCCGELRPEDVPPAEDTDIDEDGVFVVECTPDLYHAGIKHDPWLADGIETAIKYKDPRCYLFSCTIIKHDDGTFLATSSENDGELLVLVERLDKDDNVFRIVNFGTSAIDIQLKVGSFIPENEEDMLYDFNPDDFEIYPCSARLYAECAPWSFWDPYGPAYESDIEFYGHLVDNGFGKEIMDTTPEGKFYALLMQINDRYDAIAVGNSANEVSFNHPWQYIEWTDIFESGERIGKGYFTMPCEEGEDADTENNKDVGEPWGLDCILVECSVDLFYKHRKCFGFGITDKNCLRPIQCEVEGEIGHRLAVLHDKGETTGNESDNVKETDEENP